MEMIQCQPSIPFFNGIKKKTEMVTVIGSIVTVMYGSGIAIATVGAVLFSGFFEFVISCTVFLACLYYLLISDTIFVQRILEILPGRNHPDVSRLLISINRIFISSLMIMMSHGMTTFISFWLMGLDFIFLASVLTSITAIFPVLSSWLIHIPVMIILYFRGNQGWFVIFVLRIILVWFVDPLIYDKIPNSHPYITGLSIVLGIYTFGTVGVLIGPFIIIITITAYSIFQRNIRESSTPKKKPTEVRN